MEWLNRSRGGALVMACALIAVGCGGGSDADPPAEAPSPLFFPKRLTETAPAVFRARFETTAGTFVVEVHREWAPHGADRFYNLVRNGYYDDTRVYRVLDGFLAQFGIHGDPRINVVWRNSIIVDDPVTESNVRGRVSFAKGGPNSRTTEVFVSYRDNADLDGRGFAPFGEVVEGMDVVDAFHSGYGDGPPRGEGPYAARAQALGNPYFDEDFPELDRIISASVSPGG
ncbi:MAG: peptidylprolyl isomerase [Gemmatimonadota bacterium]|nr:peptidylprolyl isomerase [Gemmatimonadota bacterium]MDH5758449.1 peptidylprolyl isomerase [Gemmatimonadota bacterium]